MLPSPIQAGQMEPPNIWICFACFDLGSIVNLSRQNWRQGTSRRQSPALTSLGQRILARAQSALTDADRFPSQALRRAGGPLEHPAESGDHVTLARHVQPDPS
ncbi:hypothetical protein Poly59_48200 [Rubripirellula reticaptiva]|uniref:Uncharacterized protein n=1 Tax=Rubripirellula reticaptiva TaxID=2528013 RepID=A0A5C6EK30_9BACT|nr:hypothetical protein Poly59_48200 [Rubripirellula reticaptiva]